jgi:hypothetical protein
MYDRTNIEWIHLSLYSYTICVCILHGKQLGDFILGIWDENRTLIKHDINKKKYFLWLFEDVDEKKHKISSQDVF